MQKANLILERLYHNHFTLVYLNIKGKYFFNEIEMQEYMHNIFFELSENLQKMTEPELSKFEDFIIRENIIGYITKLAYNIIHSDLCRKKKSFEVYKNYIRLYGLSDNTEYQTNSDTWMKLEHQLPERDFSVLFKKNIEDKTYGEVAQELGLGSADNARLVHFRARNKAKALLAS